MKKAFPLGILASFFFAFTFILNRRMNLAGDHFLWSASLRYFFTFPILFGLVLFRGQVKEVILVIRENCLKWILWSTIGFGVFYAPLCFASAYGASWLVAGTWQITIVAGALLTPLFYKLEETDKGIIKIRNKMPLKALLLSSIILLGIFFLQIQQVKEVNTEKMLLGSIPVLFAAFAYPLGNRKIMGLTGKKLTTIQRVFGMTLCSLPFWTILAILGFIYSGPPSTSQILQSLIVAIFAGVIATLLFFKATDLVKSNMHQLAVVESTQSGAVIFTLIGGLLLLNDQVPSLYGLIGISLVIIGMVANSLFGK